MPLPDASRQSASVTWQILSIMLFNFANYLTIGLPLAVLPGYVHDQLGFGPFWAGLVISLQYFATLISRPYAGRYADLLGPKRVVLLGLSGCLLSGLFYWLSICTEHFLLPSLLLLAMGRILLGLGQSFAGTGSTLWGVGRVGAAHIGKVISWAGVMTYGAMAIGAPLGVWIVHLGGLATLSWTIVVVALIALCLAWRKPGVAASSSSKVPFQQVLGKILPYGVVLALASCGFGVIATFITLFYAAHHWAGAAFSLTSFSCAFVGIRLIFSNAIGRFGGLRVTLACFVVEAAGLLLVWGANSPWMAMLGATLTGCGFSLIFPALGVVAVKTMPAEHRGSALATYTLFLDLSLGVTGPLAGGLISYMGIDAIYLAAALTSLLAFLLVIHQINTEKKQHQAIQPATH